MPVPIGLPLVVVRTCVGDICKRKPRIARRVSHVGVPEGLVLRHGGIRLAKYIKKKRKTEEPAGLTWRGGKRPGGANTEKEGDTVVAQFTV